MRKNAFPVYALVIALVLLVSLVLANYAIDTQGFLSIRKSLAPQLFLPIETQSNIPSYTISIQDEQSLRAFVNKLDLFTPKGVTLPGLSPDMVSEQLRKQVHNVVKVIRLTIAVDSMEYPTLVDLAQNPPVRGELRFVEKDYQILEITALIHPRSVEVADVEQLRINIETSLLTSLMQISNKYKGFEVGRLETLAKQERLQLIGEGKSIIQIQRLNL